MFRGGQTLTSSIALSPHLNLELGLPVGVRTLADRTRPEDKAGEYQIPNEAN